MNKQEFLEIIRDGISGLPQDEIDERLAFYSEMIDDRTEDGFSEEDAVADIGEAEDVISRIISEVPLKKLVKEKVTLKKKFRAWEIVLLAVGSPIWASLLIAAVAVVFSLYISVWAAIISLWAVFGSVVISSVYGIIVSAIFIATGKGVTGVALLGGAFVCVGLSIFASYGCKVATKGILLLTHKSILALKKCFIKKEEA